MAGAGYDIGASLSASTSSSATGGQVGANSVTDNGGGSGNKETVIILAVIGFIALVFWTIFHEK